MQETKFGKLNDGLIIDMFAGGGGASVGIEMALGRSPDIAINHDPDAIRMHMVNHPKTLHLTEDIFEVDLQKYVKGRHVALIWASPDCRHFSKAKGGKPKSESVRCLPWSIYKHAKAVTPDVIICENVEEIQKWGRLDDDGNPVKEDIGKEYQRWVTAIKTLGYTFDCRELVAADYGAPTTRKRWYAVFRRDGMPIVWPEPTHSKDGADGLKPWEPAYKYLDLTDLGKSIFGRKKPLAEKTMQRIARGLDRFVFNNAEPFIVVVNHGGKNFRGQSMKEPLATITQKHGYGIVQPVLSPCRKKSGKKPLGQSMAGHAQTTDASKQQAIVAAFLTKFYKTGTGQKMTEPIHTITTSPGHFGMISVLAVNWRELQKAGIDEETARKCTWVSQFILEYYGCGTGQSIREPMHTIVTKDRFAMISIMGDEYCIMDIFLRMLTPEELKLLQGFPKDYIIAYDKKWRPYPKSKQVARIGNSVCPVMAKAIVEANCSTLKTGDREPKLYVVEDDNGQMKFA